MTTAMTVKVDLPALRTYFESQQATAKLMLDAAKTGLRSVRKLELELAADLPEPPRTDAGKIDVPVTRRRTEPDWRKGSYSDEFKTRAVRLADTYGSNHRAAKELRCTGQSIANWRNLGFGRGATSDTPAIDHAGDVRCRTCGGLAPTLQDHYKTSPMCEETNARRGR